MKSEITEKENVQSKLNSVSIIYGYQEKTLN